MDVAEYRRKYKEELARHAQNQISYRDFLNRLKAPAEESAFFSLSDTPPTSVGLPNDDDVVESISIIRNKAEQTHLRMGALRGISTEIGKSEELIDMTLGLLRDASEPSELRRTALEVLQLLSFSSPLFPSKRPEFFEVLRGMVNDPDSELRRQAIRTLAQEKDEYVQRLLIEGLEDPTKALVPSEEALSLLAYDIHAEYFPILRDIVKNPPSTTAKDQAVRLLAADPTSTGLLTEILTDKTEDPKIRRTSAVALQSLAPQEFRAYARQIALDENENDDLRATTITALGHVAAQSVSFAAESVSDRDPLDERIAELKETGASDELRRAAALYTMRRGVRSSAAPTTERLPSVQMQAPQETAAEASHNPLRIAVDVVRSFIKGLMSGRAKT